MVSIITINFNGCHDTSELVNSLAKYETYPHEVIIVDNGSSGEDVNILRKKYPDICIISSPTNSGFAGGNNLGYSYAKGEYILFLNNDVIIKGPFLEKLVERLKNDPTCGLVSPKIMYEETPDKIQFAGFTPLSYITLRNEIIGTGELDHGQYNSAHETPYVHGAAMMGKRVDIEKIGLMPEVYFLFYEELDWSEQFKRAGYKLWYEPASIVFHKESMTAKKNTPLRLFYMTRARLFFARRNLKGLEKLFSCIYLSTVSFTKNSIHYLFHKEWNLFYALWSGTLNGLRHHIR